MQNSYFLIIQFLACFHRSKAHQQILYTAWLSFLKAEAHREVSLHLIVFLENNFWASDSLKGKSNFFNVYSQFLFHEFRKYFDS